MNYPKIQLIAISKNNPKELARMLTSLNADPRMLVLGAEVLGEYVTDEEIVLPVLRFLIKHLNATVRESAMIGISSFYMEKNPPQDILDRIVILANGDPSPVVKDFAKSILKDFNIL
jgi:hypothetical protein